MSKAEQVAPDAIKAKITQVLEVYPVISPTMLQMGLGPWMKPALWRPVLQEMIEQGLVKEGSVSRNTPAGRYNTYTTLQLVAPAHGG